MPKTDYLKKADADFAAQLNTFKLNIGSYATLLGLAAGTVTAQAADAAYFSYMLTCQELAAQAAQQWTAWKDLTREGGTSPATGAPVTPTFPTAVTAVAPGIEPRFRALVKQVKAHPAYNAGMGEALGIEGNEKSGPDFSTFKPLLKLEIEGGAVQVGWTWQGQSAFLDAIEIEVDRGTGTFSLLTFDTTPDYTDTTALPATAAKWRYRAIYRVGDARVGQWSSTAEITVGG